MNFFEIKTSFDFSQPYMSKEPIFCGFKLYIMRNVDGFIFPSKLEQASLAKAKKFIESTLKKGFPQAELYEKPYPIEIEESFLELHQKSDSCLIDQKEKLTFQIMGKDHIQVIIQDDSLDFKKVYEKLVSIEKKLNALFSFTFDSKKGFLTSYPQFSGHGIALEAYLFCPHLKNAIPQDKAFLIEPIFNQNNLFVLKTKNCINIEKINLIHDFFDRIKTIMQLETSKRQEDLSKNKEMLFDQFSKSLALIKGAHRLDLNDTFEHILNLKQGFHLGALKGLKEDPFLKMLCILQKGHLSKILNTAKSQDDWLHERAQLLQDFVQKIEINPDFIK
jgi:protein-arginine kinase